MGAIIYTNGNFQAVDDNGEYVANGTLIFNNYADGTPATTFKNSDATIANPYEIPLSASGKADVYLKAGDYQVILKDADGVIVRTIEKFSPNIDRSGATRYQKNEEFVAQNDQTDFALIDAPIGSIMVFVNGILYVSSKYTVSGNTLSFSNGLNAGDDVSVHYNSIDPNAETKFPVGTIVAWGGSPSNLPTGWILCDGTNGTPDLRNTFIMGSDIASVGQTGGSADAVVVAHTHTANHNHSASSNTAGNHSHTVGFADNVGGNPNIHKNSSNSDGFSKNTSSAGNHSHIITVNTANVTTSSAGVDGAGKNLPPYYKLAYIMYIG